MLILRTVCGTLGCLAAAGGCGWCAVANYAEAMAPAPRPGLQGQGGLWLAAIGAAAVGLAVL